MPASGKLYLTLSEDMIDLIAWRYYGYSSGAVESMLEANDHDELRALASQPEVLPAAQLIVLPPQPKATNTIVQLWD